MPIVFMSVGLPASGKTTYLKRMHKISVGCEYVCADDVRAELYGNPEMQGDPSHIWSIVQNQLRSAISSGADVLVDGTFIKRADRRSLIAKCLSGTSSEQTNRIEIICLQFTTPLEVCLQRNRLRERTVPEQVIARMDHELKKNPPEEWEGFEGILKITPE